MVTQDHLLQALLAWRQNLLDAGLPESQVPLVADLRQVAGTPGVTRPVLDTLDLQRRAAVLSFAPGILATLRDARRDAVAQGTAPAAAGRATPTPPATGAAPATGSPPRRPRPRPLSSDASPGVATTSARPSSPAPEAPTPSKRQSSRRSEDVAPAWGGDGSRAAELAGTTFAPFDVEAAQTAGVEPAQVAQVDGALHLRWPALKAPAVLYRVVSRDDFDVWSPDDADLVEVTTRAEAVDRRPLTTAARYLAVFGHAGPDVQAARAAQPALLARALVVAPPYDVRLQEDHGTVLVSWQVRQGVGRVDVLRVPAGQVHRAGYVQEFVVAPVSARTSHQDTGCAPGEQYEYRLFAVFVDPVTGREHFSAPATETVRTSTLLAAVKELDAVRRDGSPVQVDLTWPQPPVGDVVVYRTPRPPEAGATLVELHASALPQAGLPADARLLVHPEVVGGQGRLRELAWPEGWPRVCFTIVTISGDAARVGRTAVLSRTSGIEEARLLERVTWQLVTFNWPADAISVDVYRTPVGAALQDDGARPLRQLSRADYERKGGARLELGGEACDLHLVPVSFLGKQQVAGEALTLEYRGVRRMAYRLRVPTPPAPAPRARRWGRRESAPPVPVPPPTLRHVEVKGEPVPGQERHVTLSLVARRDRLPLAVADGELVWSKRMPLVGGFTEDRWTPVQDVDVAHWPGGWLRLFVETDGVRVALLDPEVSSLRT